MTAPIRSKDLMTIPELCAELGISKSTFYEWRTKGIAPPCIKLPNSQIRVRRDELVKWLDTLCEDEAA